eukprot:3938320-Rhodomonas_salina.2
MLCVPCAVSGTEIGSSCALVLRSGYAMSGTDMCCAFVLRLYGAGSRSGVDIARNCGFQAARGGCTCEPICLRACDSVWRSATCYAVSGTEIVYNCAVLRQRMLSGAEIAHATVLPSTKIVRYCHMYTAYGVLGV